MYNLIHDCKNIIRIKLFRKRRFGTLEYFQLSEICLFAYNVHLHIRSWGGKTIVARVKHKSIYTRTRVN